MKKIVLVSILVFAVGCSSDPAPSGSSLPDEVELVETSEHLPIDMSTFDWENSIELNTASSAQLKIDDQVYASSEILEEKGQLLLVGVPIRGTRQLEKYIISHGESYRFLEHTDYASAVFEGIYVGTDKSTGLPVIHAVLIESR